MKTKQSKKTIVAIDGPAGTGKSTVAKLLAKKLKLPYLDTGAMYRAVTYLAVCQGYSLKEDKKIAGLAKKARIAFKLNSKGENGVTIDGLDVTHQIRTPDLTNKVHYIAANEGVRKQLVLRQRYLASRTGGVVEGRDIGTVVFPNTPHKFFLDAKFEIRVRRRYNELKSKGLKVKLKDVAADQKKRDYRDTHRKIGPLIRAQDAMLIDTSSLTIEEVVGRIARLISGKKKPLDSEVL